MTRSPIATLADITESQLIQDHISPYATQLDDDVALWHPDPQSDLLISSDLLVEDIHFSRSFQPDLIGRKAASANFSDILSSGGSPQAMILSWSLPTHTPLTWIDGFMRGLNHMNQSLEVALIGGDCTRSVSGITIAITVFGSVSKGCRIGRTGGQAGDHVMVTGHLGAVAAALAVLAQTKADDGRTEFWQKKHCCPPLYPAFAAALAKDGLATAMMDLSDGLTTDVARLCEASHIGAHIDLDLIPLDRDAFSQDIERESLWHGGEDYQLLMTINPGQRAALEHLAKVNQVPLTKIGTLVKGHGVAYRLQGAPYAFKTPPWRHFKAERS